MERAKASAAVWEARLKVTEFSRAEYREAARGLAHNNVELTQNQYQLEKDMLEVIGFLKKQDEKKDETIEKLQQQLITQQKMAEEERARLTLFSIRIFFLGFSPNLPLMEPEGPRAPWLGSSRSSEAPRARIDGNV